MEKLEIIRKNAEIVRSQFGPHSGIPNFGFNAPSIAYLDSFIDRQGTAFQTVEAKETLMNLLGSFLGEAIVLVYGGSWKITESIAQVVITRGDNVHMLDPFAKAQKRITNGNDDNLQAYFAEIIPRALAIRP
jgi:hypothetical protein